MCGARRGTTRHASSGMRLFHLRRHDTSDGTETLDDLHEGRITESAREYLNTYLHEYATEFRYIGRYTHD